jgi:TP901 family phage tail tape measure protein
MALDAGSVFAVLGGKFNPAGFAQFDAAMKKSSASATAAEASIVRSSGRSAGAMTMLGTAAKTGAAVGIVAVGYAMVKSVESAAKFDSAMRNVNSIARLSETQYKSLSKSVLELSGKTAQAPITLAKGMYDLVSSGFDAKESLLILESSAKAASAGLTTAEVATGAVAAVLNAYKRPAADAAEVSDDLFQTVNLGVLSFDALASSIGDVLPFAQAVGVPLKQVGAAVATLTKAGISAPEAMTRIKGALSALISPSTAMKEAFNKLGVASGEELISKTGSLQGALQALTGTVGNNKSAVAKLFPDIRGLSAALLTTGQNAKSANVDLAAFGDTTGATDRVLEEQKKGVDYQVQLIKAQLSQLGVQIGGALLPGLTMLLSNTTATLSAMRGDFSGFGLGVLGTVRAIVSGIGTAASVMRLVPGPIGDAWAKVGDAAKGTIGDIDRATATIRAREMKLKVGADPTEAIKVIKAVQNSKIAPKVAKILGDKKDADSKIKALIALGIPKKTARVLAETGSAEAALARVRRDLANINSKTVTLTVNKVGDAVGNLFSGKASGAMAGTAQTAIVGEGGGPEWIVDRATGKARRVSGAQLASLNANEYVIPTESKYRPQALSLLSMLAADLGVAGFAKGKAASKKPAPKKPAPKPKPAPLQVGKPKGQTLTSTTGKGKQKVSRYIPERVFAAHDLSWFETEISKRDAIKNQKKGNKLTAKALKARKELADLKKQQSSAKGYLAQINKLQTDADIDRDLMTTADNKDDQAGYNSAFNHRKTTLGSLQGKLKTAYDLALKYAPNSTWTQSLKGQLAALGVSLSEMPANAETITPEQAAAAAETTFSVSEQAQLDEFGRQIAMAELTPQLTDDQAALAGKESLLSTILSGAGNGAGRGGVTAVTQIASELKSTRDQIAGLAGGTSSAPSGITPDQQAQADQAARNQTMAAQSAAIDRLVGATLGGSPTLVFQSYVPPSPTEARRLADYTVGGIGYQGGTQSSKDSVGI